MLEQYNKKRNFDKTSEPKGKKEKPAKKDCVLRFVIQEHHARAPNPCRPTSVLL